MTRNSKITFATGCSGIGAPEVAFESLGWKALWNCEIEPFPSAVLKYHWPDVPNAGDFMTLGEKIRRKELEAPDVFVAGTPCQAFSIAGLRKSFGDKRGGLTLEYIRIADAIDDVRLGDGKPAGIFLWENVPGVLSTKDNAFGRFLAGMAGSDEPVLPLEGSRFPNAGVVCGPKREVVWRVLDAQYFGVAQRRRRVFVIASARTGFSPAEALLEFGSLPRNSPPRREARKDAAGGFETSAGKSVLSDIAGSLTARHDSSPCADRGQNVVCVGVETGHGYWQESSIAGVLRAEGAPTRPTNIICVHGSQDPIYNTEHANAVNQNQGLENCICYGIGNGQVNTAVSMTKEVSQTLDSMHDQQAILCYENHAQDSRVKEIEVVSLHAKAGTGGGNLPLIQEVGTISIAENIIGRQEHNGGNGAGFQNEIGYTLNATGVHGDAVQGSVRRLTTVECARLQAFPDHHTEIPWRGKPKELCPDGPQYKAYGNSMCVNVIRWIGKQIEKEEQSHE